MKYSKIRYGTFLDRPNRFIAHVRMEDGKEETVHVKNTGRCREILLPGARVALAVPDNSNRKTAYDLVGVYKEEIGWINVDSQAPNEVVKEWLLTFEPDYLKPEYTFGKSRIDFYLEQGGRKILMEVKGVTLEREHIAYFPDAPTERGVKHMEELAAAAEAGYECYAAFVVPMEGIEEVRPNVEIHPEFGAALERAARSGVGILCLGCSVSADELHIAQAKKMKIF
ncbi:MAG: DNA/RNA nuclease SfsA [Roseburia sp.]